MPKNDNSPIDSSSLHTPFMQPSTSRPPQPSKSPQPPALPVADQQPISIKVETPASHDDTATALVAPPTKEQGIQQQPQTNTPGVLVLQWLTYAFWGWTTLVVAWMTFTVVGYLFGTTANEISSATLPYQLAAVLVLIPLSIICDLLYSRKEPLRKTGSATILMIIHAVIFALFGIAALISCVYLLITLALYGNDNSVYTSTSITSTLIVAILYVTVFLRTLNPLAKKHAGRWLSIGMAVIACVYLTINFIGPAQHNRRYTADQTTSKELALLVNKLDRYGRVNHHLPSNLSDDTFDGRDNPLVTTNAIRYTYHGASALPLPSNATPDEVQENTTTRTLNFTACVTYKSATPHPNDYLSSASHDSSVFYTPSTHPAGEVCYNLYVLDSDF